MIDVKYIILLGLLQFAEIRGNVPANMIKNFVRGQDDSLVVEAILCNRRDAATLFTSLSQDFIPARASTITNLKMEEPANHLVFVIDLCSDIPNLLIDAEHRKLLRAPYKWLFFSTTLSMEDSIVYFRNASILVDSDVTLAKVWDGGASFRKINKIRRHLRIVNENFGTWSEKEGVKIEKTFQTITSRRRKDLARERLNSSIVITHKESLNHLTDKRDKHIDSIGKVNFVLTEHLKDTVNASIHHSVQSTWGYKDNNSNWSGMIGELTKGLADIGGTALFMTSDRVAVIDYLSMTTPTRSKFIFLEPKLSYVTDVYTLPFSRTVWVSTIFLVVVTSMVLYIVIKWEHKKNFIYALKENTSNSPELQDSITDVAVLAFGAFCQQGASAIPHSVSGRITTIYLFISLMFLYTSYSASIVALLQSSSDSIQTLEDLLKSRLQVGVDDTVFNHFYFPNATEPIRKAIYLEKVAPAGQKPQFYSIEEGIRRMRQGLFAFHVEIGSGYKIVEETFQEAEKCGLKEIEYLQVSDPWLAVQKNSSFKEMLKIGLRKIHESGIQNREVLLIYTRKPICTGRGSSFINVGLVDCYPVAVVFAGGIIVSSVIFLIELLYAYKKN